MSKQGPHLGAGGWFISRMYRHSPSESNNVIITGLRHHTHTPQGRLFPISLSRCGRSYGGVFAWVRGLLLLLLKVKRPFHSGLPALGFALGLGQLHHKEGKHNHGTKKRKHRDGLAHLLIIAARHYSWGNTQTWITALFCLNFKGLMRVISGRLFPEHKANVPSSPPGMSQAPLSPGDRGRTWGRYGLTLGKTTLSMSTDSSFWCFHRLLRKTKNKKQNKKRVNKPSQMWSKFRSFCTGLVYWPRSSLIKWLGFSPRQMRACR